MKRNKLLIAGISVVIIAIISIIILLNNSYTVPVLMYHSISPNNDNSRLIVEKDTFKKQMNYLKDHGFNFLTLDEYVELKKEKRKPKKKSVVITFDDGFKNNYTLAYPILNKLYIPATMFIVTNWVGKKNRLSWEQVKELSADPLIDIGSHTLNHYMLTRIPQAEAMREIRFSKKVLEEKLGCSVDLLAYPTGDHSVFIKKLTRLAGYKAACATSVDKRTSLDDLYAIRRIRISQRSDNLFIFAVQVSGYYNFFRDRRIKKGKWKRY